MKRTVILVLATLTICSISFSQKCKYKKNEVDKFTGVKILETKGERLCSSPYIMVSGLKNDNQCAFRIEASVSANGIANFSIEKGQQLLFLLTNNDTIMLKANETIMGDPSVAKSHAGLDLYYEGTVRNDYNLSQSQLEKLKKSNLNSLRLFVSCSDNRKFPINKEFSKKGEDLLMNIVNCVTAQ